MLAEGSLIATLNQGGNLMSQVIGLNLSGSFTEIFTEKEGSVICHRQLTPNLNLQPVLKKLKENFTEDETLHFRIATRLAREILNKKLGSPPAFIVTQGFEDWLEMNLPVEARSFDQHKRTEPPVLRDLTFGLEERTNAQGEVLTPVNEEEIDLIISKLELHNIDRVALGLLHSTQNPSNLEKCQKRLKEKNIQVFDCQAPEKNERHRWMTAVLNGYAHRQFNELVEEIKVSICSHFPMATFEILSDKEDYKTNAPHLISTQFAVDERLLQSLTMQNLEEPFALYLGLEDIELISLKDTHLNRWHSQWGPSSVTHPRFQRLGLQATQVIENGFWGHADFSSQESGYAPGPISFGKSTQLTLMDIFLQLGWLQNITGFTDRVKERAQRRIEESLYAYCRDIIHEEGVDLENITQGLGELALQMWSTEIQQLTGGQPVIAFGPIAESLFKYLRMVTPNLRLMTTEHHSFLASQSLFDKTKTAPDQKGSTQK